MKLGMGWQGSREPAVEGEFAVSECVPAFTSMCLLKMR